MKKLAALLLAALLLLAVSAVAEYVPATLASGRCTLEFPGNYIIVNDDTVAEIMQSEEVAARLAPAGIDISDLNDTGMEIICDENLTGCLVLNRKEEHSSRLLLRLRRSAYDAELIKAYSSMGIDKADMNPRGIFRAGLNTYYGFELNYSGSPMGHYITVDSKGNKYLLTFLGFSSEIVDHVLETFTSLN